jgi:hypothetical protein
MTTYISPTPRQRLLALAKCALPLLAFYALSRMARGYTEHVNSLPLCEQAPWVIATIVACATALAVFSLLCGRSALRILRSGQYPAPGTSVLFRTRVYTGWWALTNGISLLLMAILIAAFAVGMLSLFVFPVIGQYIAGTSGCTP